MLGLAYFFLIRLRRRGRDAVFLTKALFSSVAALFKAALFGVCLFGAITASAQDASKGDDLNLPRQWLKEFPETDFTSMALSRKNTLKILDDIRPKEDYPPVNAPNFVSLKSEEAKDFFDHEPMAIVLIVLTVHSIMLFL